MSYVTYSEVLAAIILVIIQIFSQDMTTLITTGMETQVNIIIIQNSKRC